VIEDRIADNRPNFAVIGSEIKASVAA